MNGSDSGGRWLLIGLLAGAALMLALYGLPPMFADPAPPNCGPDCLASLDLPAQRSMASAAWAMFGVTAASAGIGAASLWLIWLNLVAARDVVREASISNDTMVRVAREQSRAYLDATGGTFDVFNGPAVISLVYANAGQTPARRIRITGNWSIERRDGDLWAKLAARSARNWKPALPSGGTGHVSLTFPDVLDDAYERLEDDMQLTVRFVLRGNFAYDDVFGDRHHETFQFRSKSMSAAAALLIEGNGNPLERLPEPSVDTGDD